MGRTRDIIGPDGRRHLPDGPSILGAMQPLQLHGAQVSRLVRMEGYTLGRTLPACLNSALHASKHIKITGRELRALHVPTEQHYNLTLVALNARNWKSTPIIDVSGESSQA